ncbi:hypothetical protein GLAREA_04101 [Glarea lozoyensis ATCC 20868]|uniref:CHAT domain-containing protein n=1 Tax=Glarea lozoyensis (strain ATCC 20868 / MF5171) TaxID=1116229 RepID=S3D1T7_GLAL2|nr:uncharacterized protein GLAREA_04101 [Glarea lozoyensis ATCC 20868]EPE31134.1 hypothetical protein GLAREA_04101 [Glarea lozoyensis ATCC 20868]
MDLTAASNRGYLDEAILNLSKPAADMPENHSTRAMCLNNLGKAYEFRFQYSDSKSDDDFNNALTNFELALKLDSAAPMLRVTAGYRGMVLSWPKNPTKAIEFLELTTNLLPTISPRLLNRADQQDNIATFAGFASIGASILLETGRDTFDAIKIMEASRGVMSSLQLETRIDTSCLEDYDKDLAAEFIALRDLLDSPPTDLLATPKTSINLEKKMERRITASKRLNEILLEIHTVEQLNDLILGLSEQSLKSLAETGPIVTVNVSSIRSDALIVTKNRIWNCRLPELHHTTVLEQARTYLDTLREDSPIRRKKTNRFLHTMLKWLWDYAVGPILSELGIASKKEDWPRIWWVPVGLMSIFPLHAAGDHSGKTDENALDRVILSYSTTMKSLSHSRKLSQTSTNSGSQKAVFIAMSSTPNERDLVFAEPEVTQLLSLIPETTCQKTTFKSPAYKTDVLQALTDCNIAHFSCHGIIDNSNPSNTSLLLTDWESNPLTVADINVLKLSNAQLACLSACHASSNRTIDLLDEGIHLTGAFQMAGFPRSIGSLWQVDDERSGMVSKIVWENMLGVDGTIDYGKAAEGLHKAVRALREAARWVEGVEMRFDDQPVVWAPFIYMGV